MPPISVWGPPTWTFLHVLAEKISEADFAKLHVQLFGFIKQIGATLPCPDCAQHATAFFNKIKMSDISTKQLFIDMLYLFHNMVSAKKRKPLFNHVNMSKYKTIPIQIAYQNFVSVFNTRGDMRMLTETFRRQLVIKNLRNWLITHRNSFI